MSPQRHLAAVLVGLSAIAQAQSAQAQSTADTGRDEKPVSVGQPTEATSLASASANFTARTGIELGEDDQGSMVVKSVRSESDASRAGIKAGDRLAGIEDHNVRHGDALDRFLAAHPSQAAFIVSLQRGEKQFDVALGRKTSMLGMLVFPDKSDRPVVRKVDKNSSADQAKVKAGDLIAGLSGRRIDTMQQFNEFAVPLVREMKMGQEVPLHLMRDGRELSVAVIRPENPGLPLLTPPPDNVAATPAPGPTREVRRTTIRSNTVMRDRQRQNNPQHRMTDQEYLGGLSGLGIGLNVDGQDAGAAVPNATGGTNGVNGANGLNGVGVGVTLPGGNGFAGVNAATSGTSAGNQSMAANAAVAVLHSSAVDTTTSTTAGTSAAGNHGFNPHGAIGFVVVRSTGQTNPTGTTGAAGAAAGTTATNNAGVTGTTSTGAAGTTATQGSPGAAAPNGSNAAALQAQRSLGSATPNSGSLGNTAAVEQANAKAAAARNARAANNNNVGTDGLAAPQALVMARVVGLTPGQYVVAVHQFGDCGDVANGSAGPVVVVLGTLTVDESGRGALDNAPANVNPQALLGHVLSISPGTQAANGGRIQAPTNANASTTGRSNATTRQSLMACGVFGLGSPSRRFNNAVQNSATTNGTNNAPATNPAGSRSRRNIAPTGRTQNQQVQPAPPIPATPESPDATVPSEPSPIPPGASPIPANPAATP